VFHISILVVDRGGIGGCQEFFILRRNSVNTPFMGNSKKSMSASVTDICCDANDHLAK
jgi:hypothetical protein